MASKHVEHMRSEANKYQKIADKAMSKGIMKWSVDYEAGAVNYEKAATCYRNAKDYDEAKKYFVKSSTCHYKNGALHHAGKCLESAALVCKDQKLEQEAAQFYSQAATIYTENSCPDKAAEVLTKAAKAQEDTGDNDTAVDLYMQALDIYETEEREHMSHDTFRKAAGLLVKAERYQEAGEVIKRQASAHKKMDQTTSLFKCYISVLVVHLKDNDYIGADKLSHEFMKEDDRFITSDEYFAVSSLLDAYERNDQAALDEAKKAQQFHFLDNQIGKLVRTLTIPAGGVKGAGSSMAAEIAGIAGLNMSSGPAPVTQEGDIAPPAAALAPAPAHVAPPVEDELDEDDLM